MAYSVQAEVPAVGAVDEVIASAAGSDPTVIGEMRPAGGRPWLFGDEWQRGRRYGVVLVAANEHRQLSVVRRELRRLLLPGEKRFHMAHERPARRRAALSRLARLPLQGYVTETRGHPVQAREECLARLLTGLAAFAPGRLTLERQDDGQQARDRRWIARLLDEGRGPADLRYEHADPNVEPMLWAADIVAWAVGKGGEWRRRASPIITDLF